MEQSGLTRWNVAGLAVLYTLHAGVYGRYGSAAPPAGVI